MNEENVKAETDAEATVAEEPMTEEAVPQKKKGKKWPIITGVVIVVLIAAGAGFWVWHEQPSFCNAICHTPMDQYNVTYDQEPGVEGVDKWGNTVEDTSSMLAVTHRTASMLETGEGATCMSCHSPVISQQMEEGMKWVTGDYTYPLEERDADALVKWTGIEPDEFCLNESCHNMTRDDLISATSSLEFNPHIAMHGETACTDCHKAHRASVYACTQCHTEAEAPEGWLTVAEEKALDQA